MENLLEEQLAERRRNVAAETLSMSIGELTSLYREGTLNVHPEFQRVYRWDQQQKTALVESILLGIPIPSIFVAVTDEQWEIVDGVQRVSTLLELQGELRGPGGERLPPFTMGKAELLDALEGYSWSGAKAFSSAQKLDVRTSRIDVKLLRRDSSPQTKYDLFQRLNGQGTALTPQEFRNCLIVSESPAFLTLIEQLVEYPGFSSVVALPERQITESYRHELVLRFLALHQRDMGRGIGSLHKFLNQSAVELARKFEQGGLGDVVRRFRQTFDFLAEHGDEDVFRRWDPRRSRFGGAFLIGAYEVFALGVGYLLARQQSVRTDLRTAARELWTQHGGTSVSQGRSAESRAAKTIPLGRELLAAR